MKRWTWIAIVVVVVAAAGVWGWPRLQAAQMERAAARIEAMEDAAEKSDQAVAFLRDHPDACDGIRARVFLAGLDGARQQGGDAPVVFCDSVLEQNLSKEERATVTVALDRALLDTGDPDDAARADDAAREAAKSGACSAEDYLRMAWQHAGNEMSDPWVAVELATAGAALGDSATAAEWPGTFDNAYGRVMNSAAMERGLDGVYALTDSILSRATTPLVPGAVYANLYRLRVEEDPRAAVDAARSLASLPGYTGGSVMNDIAYDMAERKLEPRLAVTLADAALGFAASEYDSMSFLDTAGWANYRAGNHDDAAAHLAKAFSMLDETPSYQNDIVRHLATAYEAAGKTGEAIDLLALVVSRSVDPADPARTELSRLLRKRDGSDAALEDLVKSKLAAGLEEAPAFALEDREGAKVELAALRGSVVVVCFWSYG